MCVCVRVSMNDTFMSFMHYFFELCNVMYLSLHLFIYFVYLFKEYMCRCITLQYIYHNLHRYVYTYILRWLNSLKPEMLQTCRYKQIHIWNGFVISPVHLENTTTKALEISAARSASGASLCCFFSGVAYLDGTLVLAQNSILWQ